MEAVQTVAIVVACAIALLRALTLWWPDIRAWWYRRSRPAVRRVPSEPFTFRGVRFTARTSDSGRAVWQRKADASDDVEQEQLDLAKATFSKLADFLLEASVSVLKSHAAWFEGEFRRTAGQLASEMDVESVSAWANPTAVTVYARHPSFSGHVLEITVTLGRRVTHVDLLG